MFRFPRLCVWISIECRDVFKIAVRRWMDALERWLDICEQHHGGFGDAWDDEHHVNPAAFEQ